MDTYQIEETKCPKCGEKELTYLQGANLIRCGACGWDDDKDTKNNKPLDEILGDVWDVRDLIELFESLESELVSIYNEQANEEDQANDSENDSFTTWLAGLDIEEAQEFKNVQDVLNELKGNGGDEQWRGDWYPVTMIRENYFIDYCMELVQDVGDLPRDIPSYLEIDWEATADNLKIDYSEIDIDGDTYYYR